MIPRCRLALLFALILSWPLAAHAEEAWEQQIATILGVPGTEAPDGVYKVSLPRSDLKVMMEGVTVKTALALGGWLAFKPMGDQTMVMGDLVLIEAEVNPVMARLEAAGIDVTALHNHLLGAKPNPMYLHVSGHGDPAKLAAALRNALEASQTPLTKPSGGTANEKLDLDTTAIDGALGHKGKVNGGVYQISVPRANPVTDGGTDIPPSMGTAIAINFQPIGKGKAATTGDFVLIAEEVNPVIKALGDNGIAVTAVHSHMLTEQPRLFFLHFWANGDTAKLAKGLRAALDRVNVAAPG